MKIAIATEGTMVCSHFGRCESFTVCEVEGSNVTERRLISTEGNQHAALPDFLAGQGIKLVISGGMGGGAMEKLRQQGIEFIIGVSGAVDEAVEKYAAGQLTSTDAVCEEHHHSHEAGHKCKCSCDK